MSPFAIVSRNLHLSNNSLRAIPLILALLICLAGIAAHIHLRSSLENTRGPLALLDHIFDLTLAVGLSVLLLCVGRYVVKKFGTTHQAVFCKPAKQHTKYLA